MGKQDDSATQLDKGQPAAISAKVTGSDPDFPKTPALGGNSGGTFQNAGATGNSKRDTPDRDFAAALMMIERLPLSDEQKAEAVRRLLNSVKA